MSLFTSTLRIIVIAISCSASAQANAQSTFEKMGDVMQVALPLAAAYCATRQNDLRPYAKRFAGQFVVTQGLKYGLGNSQLNQRPDGGSHGFPSGHTAAAFYGASYLSHNNCLKTRGQRAIAYSLAIAVGASRIDSNKHNLGQVAAGALIGYYFDNLTVSFTDNKVSIGKRYNF
jgi:membrane-associated phospholipid phosphatase